MWDTIFDYSAIIIADLILSGDNALIIGMAAAGLPTEQRKKAIFYGMVIAAVLRIVFAIIATKLLGVPGLLFVGGLLLLWVCWSLYTDIRNHTAHDAEGIDENAESDADDGKPKRTMKQALIAITIADVSMSLDNVLAVAAIADGDSTKLIVGLGLAILLMAFAATLIMKLLAKYPWISWLGLIVLLYVAFEMLYRGITNCETGIGPILGIISETQCVPTGKGGGH